MYTFFINLTCDYGRRVILISCAQIFLKMPLDRFGAFVKLY